MKIVLHCYMLHAFLKYEIKNWGQRCKFRDTGQDIQILVQKEAWLQRMFSRPDQIWKDHHIKSTMKTAISILARIVKERNLALDARVLERNVVVNMKLKQSVLLKRSSAIEPCKQLWMIFFHLKITVETC